MRHPWLILFALAFFLAACGGPKTPGPLQSRLEGDWLPNVLKVQLRRIIVARAALADPPRADEVEKMKGSDEERREFSAIVKLRTTDEHSPKLEDLRKAIAALDATSVSVTGEKIVIRNGQSGKVVSEDYSVDSEDSKSITLTVKGDTITVEFTDNDHVTMLLGGKRIELTRKTALFSAAMNP